MHSLSFPFSSDGARHGYVSRPARSHTLDGGAWMGVMVHGWGEKMIVLYFHYMTIDYQQ
jgi:hypothetical protein